MFLLCFSHTFNHFSHMFAHQYYFSRISVIYRAKLVVQFSELAQIQSISYAPLGNTIPFSLVCFFNGLLLETR